MLPTTTRQRSRLGFQDEQATTTKQKTHGLVDVRQMLSNPLYGYGINLVPSERVAEAVMQLNTKLAHEMHDSGATFTLNQLDQHFQALFLELEKSGHLHT